MFILKSFLNWYGAGLEMASGGCWKSALGPDA
jgi:hypothetical protein